MANIERISIALLGDSLTQMSFSPDDCGWGAGLADWYSRSANIYNQGYSGYNSRWIKSMLPNLFPKNSETSKNLDLVTLLLGSNDCNSEENGQHVPVGEYKANLISIIQYIFSLNTKVSVILIVPPPMKHEQIPSLWGNRTAVSKYVAAVEEIFNELKSVHHNLYFYNPWVGEYAIDIEHDLADGLHFNSLGNKKIFLGLQRVITTQLPQLVPENSIAYPDWSALSGLPLSKIEELLVVTPKN